MPEKNCLKAKANFNLHFLLVIGGIISSSFLMLFSPALAYVFNGTKQPNVKAIAWKEQWEHLKVAEIV